MASRPVNVLFTSAGRRVELLRAFRRAIEQLDAPGRLVAIDVDPLAPALRLADRPYIVPRLDRPDYVPALCEILRREEISVVFPLIDPDIPKLAAHREELEATGARLAVVPAQAAAVARDKWQTVEFFARLGLDVPRSWLPGQLDPQTAQYPLFIKPRDGSASQQTFRVENARQLEFFSEYIHEPIIQEYLQGPEITNDVVCDLQGRVLSVVSRQRIRVRAGEVIVGKTLYDPALVEACTRVAAALPAIGPITVQCMMHAGRPHFTEINARMGGGLPLGIAAGVDWPRWLLARVAGLEVDVPPLGPCRQDLYLTRFDDSFFVSETERDAMASHSI